MAGLFIGFLLEKCAACQSRKSDGLFIGFLVEKCAACQSRKSDFGWHRFRFSPCLIPKRVEKTQAILALLDSFMEMHLEW